jgi:hypothetical protein
MDCKANVCDEQRITKALKHDNLITLLAKQLSTNPYFFDNFSCRCPPRLNPRIPDHNTGQGMPFGAHCRAPDTQVRVSRNAPFLPGKQAHALRPLGAPTL